MQSVKRIVITVFICLLLLFLLATPVFAGLGVGVAPAEIEILDALKGEEYERIVTVFNTSTDTCKFLLRASGEAGKWVHFFKPTEPTRSIKSIKIPGKKSAHVLVKFKIPKDAANGDYEAKIYAESAPMEKGEGGGQTAKVSAAIPIKIEVTDEQILKGVVKGITVRDVEINYPVEIKVEFENTGNVWAKPEIKVDITQAGKPVENFTYAKTKVKVLARKIIPVKWDTKGRGLGDYMAKVSVSLGKKELTTENLPFKILELGTLSRKGFLESLSYKGNLKGGNIIKILAKFRNNGKIDTNAKFIGEVYRNSNLVDKIESENSIVPIYEARTMESYLKIPGKGLYEVRGYVSFEGKKSNTRKLIFRLGYPLWMQILFFGGLGLILASGGWFFVWRPRKAVGKHAK